MSNQDIDHLRTSYNKGSLDRGDLLDDPIALFRMWFAAAESANVPEPNVMTLATIGQGSGPSARVVLLKGIDDDGFLFFTNYQSRKGQELEQNPHAALVFYWHDLERQVRVEGKVSKVDEARSKSYFQSRPLGSQMGAWASPQSRIIVDRQELEDRLEELNDVYKDYPQLPKPAHWGGYLLVPHYLEFWQGRPDRLHDRFEYKKERDNLSSVVDCDTSSLGVGHEEGSDGADGGA